MYGEGFEAATTGQNDSKGMRVWTETSELVAHFMQLTTRINFETKQWQSLLTRLTK